MPAEDAGRLKEELAKARQDLGRLAVERNALAERSREQRVLDPVSGLLNRQNFELRLDELLAEMRHNGRLAAVLVVGVARLARVRAAYGFAMADEVVRRLADRLRGTVAPSVVVARIGDDEFALAWSAPRVAQDALAQSYRLIDAIESPIRIERHDVRFMPSVGVALFPEDGARAQALLAHAYGAMHFARDHGSRLCQFFRPPIEHGALRLLEVEADLRRGLDQEEFTVHYQPRRELRTGAIVGVEALLRWNHPERGLLDAQSFIDVAVGTGLIAPIGEVVLRQACRDATRWPDPIRLSVNLSPREFRGARLETIVDRVLAESGLAPGRFLIEITEASLAGEDADIALVRLTALRQRGVHLVLDNFGTGAGSLDLLRRCRAEHVKLSTRLMRGVDEDRDRLAVVRASSALARRFGAVVIAEGIESERDAAAALRAGCAQGQGYLLGMPVPPGELLATLAQPDAGQFAFSAGAPA
jgi:diguanylate cyclase (GGDEF)-like protein